MSVLKVYGYYGKTTAVLHIPVGRAGKAFIDVEFKGGRTNQGHGYKPAVYSTDDPAVQSMIENSPFFGKSVKLVRSYDNGSEVAAPLATEKPEAAVVELLEMPEIATREQAVAYLKSRGATATQLRTDSAIQKVATRLGVTFPNLNLD